MISIINIQTLITILFITILIISIIEKIISKRKLKINIGKIISTIVSLGVGLVFFFTFLSIFSRFSFEFYPPIYGLEILFKIFLSFIPVLFIISIFFSIFKNINRQTKKEVESEFLKAGIDNKTIEAFKKLGASPNMSYTQINELLYKKVKQINENTKLSLKEKEKLIKELDEAFDIISEYFKNK